MAETVAAYIRGRRSRQEVRPGSIRTIRYTLNTLLDSTGWDFPTKRFRRTHVEKWLARRELSPASRRSQLSIVRVFCQWAVEQGHMPKDPTLGIRGVRQPRYMPRGLTLDQVQAILSACPDVRAELVILLEVQCGLRACEVAGIELGDIDHGERLLLVREGKGGHQRVVPIPTEAWDAIGVYLRQRPTFAGPLIRHDDSQEPLSAKYLSRYVSSIMRAAGIPGGGHALRHTCATDLLKKGVHIRNVQRLLGHQSIATTEGYLPWVVGDLRSDVEGRKYRPNRKPRRRAAGGEGDDYTGDDAA